ncbi:MAG: AAA family ATPase [Deltaproteobacteria bacterium]|nr:AAA family ATPase [Deltaproteobacteria bacterium]
MVDEPLHPRFEIRGRLGAGGGGVVYRAHDRERGHEVALKTLRHPGAGSQLRLKQEFRALADVAHPNLLPLYDLFVDESRCFFTMELVEGVDVVSWIRRDAAAPSAGAFSSCAIDAPTTAALHGAATVQLRPRAAFDEGRLRDALAQLAAGIAALHAHGKLHRDLKPSNVLVREDGHLSILDYGLVRDEREAGESRSFEGTAAYAAPEQAVGDAGPAADWYALGVIVFQAITGVELCSSLLAREPAARTVPEGLVRAEIEPRNPPLLGRERELAALELAFAESAREGRTVVVEGPSGIGKSSLVRAFLASVRARGCVVLEGRCHPREAVPYNALDGVVDELAKVLRARGANVHDAALSRVFPVLAAGEPRIDAAVDADAVRRRAFAALRATLASLGGSVVVFVDDFQWADRDSRALLGELVRTPSLFVLAQREDERPLPWSATRLEVAPLDARSARALLRHHAGGELDVRAEAMLEIADGHPMFLQEIAGHARERRIDAEPPRSLEHLLGLRIAALAATQRRLLALLGVAFTPLPVNLLAAAAGLPLTVTLRETEALRQERLARATARGFEPIHDRVREAVLATLTDDELRACHAAWVDALSTSEAHAPRALARHLAGTGDHAAARAATLAAAARAEEALAFDQAALLLRDAMTFGERGDDVRFRLAAALANAQRGVEAAEVYLGIEGPGRIRASARAGELLLASGEIARGSAALDEVLATIDRPLPRSQLGAVASLVRERIALSLRGLDVRVGPVDPLAAERSDLFRGIAQGLGMADNLRAAIYNTRSLRAALDLGDPTRAAVALATEAIFRGSVDVRRRPRELLDRARALAEVARDPTAHAWIAGAEAVLDALALDHSNVIDGLLRAEAFFQERTQGNGWALDSLKLVRALTLRLLGDLETLRTRLPEDLADARRRGDRYLETTLRRGAASVWLCDGDVDRARDALESSRWAPMRDGFHIQHWLEIEGRAEIDLYEGNASTTLTRLRGELRAMRTSLLARLQRPRILSRATRGKLLLARAAAGKDRLASLAECEWLAARLWGEEVGYARARALLLRAGVAALRGREAAAIVALREAIVIADRVGLALTGAVARQRLAARIGGDEGRALRERSSLFLRGARIARPERIAEVEAPCA